MSDQIRRNMALFSIGTVKKLTDLSARQIRYYEQHKLIAPTRTAGNQRMFSFHDVDRLLEIKHLIEKGVNIAGIKQMMQPIKLETEKAPVSTPTHMHKAHKVKRRELSDQQLHQILKQQIFSGNRHGQASLIQGELSSYFKQGQG